MVFLGGCNVNSTTLKRWPGPGSFRFRSPLGSNLPLCLCQRYSVLRTDENCRLRAWTDIAREYYVRLTSEYNGS